MSIQCPSPRRPRSRYLPAIAAATIGLFTANADAAATVHPQPQLTVSYIDLNLAHPQDVATLYGRINRASRAVCAVFAGRSLQQHAQFDKCRIFALNTAIEAVANPALTSYSNTHRENGDSTLQRTALR